MGMAASQARLLSLTARLHDVELKAQNIMSQKIALATQKDELYRDYCDALDATSIKVAYWDGNANTKYIDANYNSVCTYNKDRVKQYALKNNRTGNMMVSENVKQMYEEFGNDKYAFAYAMLGFDGNFNWDESGTTSAESGMFVGIIGGAADADAEDSALGYIAEADGSYSLYMTECEQMVFDEHKEEDADLKDKYNEILDTEDKSQKQKALDEFRDLLYDKYSKEIFEYMNINKGGSKGIDTDLDNPEMEWADISGEFNFYVNLWSAIKEAGGCEVIDPTCISGEEGTNWFNNMVEAGMVTIQVWDDTGNRKEWSDTSVATSTNNNYLQEMQDDKELKKAEAEYEHELGIINRKDTKFDTELSKLETERTSITTEIDSITTVRDDNIERTFGIFS